MAQNMYSCSRPLDAERPDLPSGLRGFVSCLPDAAQRLLQADDAGPGTSSSAPRTHHHRDAGGSVPSDQTAYFQSGLTHHAGADAGPGAQGPNHGNGGSSHSSREAGPSASDFAGESGAPGESAAVEPPRPADHQSCPRCKSADTKFVYWNNHNSKQPRHYCRACERHWTHGGCIRASVPVGSGSRKRRKRSQADAPGGGGGGQCPNGGDGVAPVGATVGAALLLEDDPLRLPLCSLANSPMREHRVLAAQAVCAGLFMSLVDGGPPQLASSNGRQEHEDDASARAAMMARLPWRSIGRAVACGFPALQQQLPDLVGAANAAQLQQQAGQQQAQAEAVSVDNHAAAFAAAVASASAAAAAGHQLQDGGMGPEAPVITADDSAAVAAAAAAAAHGSEALQQQFCALVRDATFRAMAASAAAASGGGSGLLMLGAMPQTSSLQMPQASAAAAAAAAGHTSGGAFAPWVRGPASKLLFNMPSSMSMLPLQAMQAMGGAQHQQGSPKELVQQAT